MSADVISLPDLLVLLEHLIEDVDLLDEQLVGHRHAVNDPARQQEMRITGDDLTDAWAALLRARVRLTTLVAS